MEKGGIYAIYNSQSGKIYVGQSKDLARREKDHFRELRKGTHHNKYLQRAYQKYGEVAFHFITLERCPVEKLDEKEKNWIAQMGTMDSRIGYNLEGGGNAGKEVSEAVREAKRGEKNPMYGKPLSIGHIEALRIKNRCHNSALTEKSVAMIKQKLLEGASADQIIQEFGISKDILYSIRAGKNFGWVREDLTKALKEKERSEKEARNLRILKMEAEGISRKKIAEEIRCEPTTVTRVIGKRSDRFTNSEKKETLKQLVVTDFLADTPRDEIIRKYGISQSTYVKMISDAYNERRKDDVQKAIELRKQGVMVKDIAEQLGYARTTITKWTLGDCAPEKDKKSKLAGKAIAMKKQGMKVHDIAEQLGVHRATVSRWTKGM